jgi:TolB-like protein/cytochrome c-type biogenesis protein CcmH/NrfG
MGESGPEKSSEVGAQPLGASAGATSRPVFISYASVDAPLAQKVCAALEVSGYSCWIAPRDVVPGTQYADGIVGAIDESRILVLIVSKDALASAHVGRELERAASKRHPIVALKLDPAPLSRAFEYFLNQSQWIEVGPGGTDGAIAKLVEAVKQHLPSGSAAAPTHASSDPARKAAMSAPVWGGAGALVVLALIAAYLLVNKAWLSNHETAAVANDNSIAVLPFVDMSEKHDQEYFSDGLAEELIDVLSRVPNLRVPARTSSFSFKGKPTTIGEIAHTLGVTHVLEGSVRKAGDHMRITVQLVRSDNGFHLWSQTYDRDVRDIFAVQDDIAHAVAEQLKITLLGSDAAVPRESISPEAHNLYLQARYLTDRDSAADLDQAVLLYQQALALAPNYAPAWAWLAFCHVRRVGQGLDTTGTGFTKTTSAARRAIAIDPKLPDPYVMLAIAHLQYDRDWKAAAAELEKVTALDPNNALGQQSLGHLNIASGRMSDALTHFRRAVAGDPLNLLHSKFLGRALHYAGHPAESAALLRHAIELNAQFPGLHYELGRALLRLGDSQAALTAFEAEADPAWRSFGLPLGYFATHREQEARAALAALVAQSAGSEFQVAETFAFFGEADKSFEWLDRARTLHDPGIIWSRRDPLLASIIGDARYGAFLQQLGMPPVPKDD